MTKNASKYGQQSFNPIKYYFPCWDENSNKSYSFLVFCLLKVTCGTISRDYVETSLVFEINKNQ